MIATVNSRNRMVGLYSGHYDFTWALVKSDETMVLGAQWAPKFSFAFFSA